MSSIRLKHASGNSMSLAAPGTNPASNLELKLPHTIGSANQLLKVDGSGQLGWADDNSGLSISNNADNRIVTGTGSALNAEAYLTYDSQVLTVNGTSNDTPLILDTTNSNGAHMRFRTNGGTQHFLGCGGGISLGDSQDLSMRAYDNLLFATGNSSSERLRIDSSGRLLIGHSATRAIAGGNSLLQIEKNSSELATFLRTSNDNGAAWLAIAKSRSSAGVACQAGDNIGAIAFIPHDGTDLNHHAAEIRAYVDTGIGTDDTPGYLTFHTNSGAATTTERLRIHSNGAVSIANTRNYYGALNVEAGVITSGASAIDIKASGTDKQAISFGDHNTISGELRITNNTKISLGTSSNHPLTFYTGTGRTEKLRITSNGSVNIGTTGGYAIWNGLSQDVNVKLEVRCTVGEPAGMALLEERGDSNPASFIIGKSRYGSGVGVITSGDSLGWIKFSGADGTRQHNAAGILAWNNGTVATGRVAGNLSFYTAPDSVSGFLERLRINSSGVVQVVSERLTLGTSITNGGANDGNLCVEFSSASRNAVKLRDTHNTGSTTYMVLVGGSATVGSITGTTGQASYNNLSDYRSKENDVKITDGIAKLKLLRPIRFNYKTDSSTLCDGFFAHEVTPAVPTAVTGEKDAVDSEGKIDAQMLDTSKMVPLLTAALQEAITKIETLETKVAALEAG